MLHVHMHVHLHVHVMNMTVEMDKDMDMDGMWDIRALQEQGEKEEADLPFVWDVTGAQAAVLLMAAI